MKKGLQWKAIIVVAVLALAIFLAYPPKDKIKLGLDLKGGIHLVLQVLTEDAINMETDQEIARFEELFKKNNITFQTAAKERPGRFVFSGTVRRPGRQDPGPHRPVHAGTGITPSPGTS